METLRELRRRKGLSQKDLAEKSGIGQDSISAIESGRHEPRPSTIQKLAKALNVDPEELTAPKAVVVDMKLGQLEVSAKPVKLRPVSVTLNLRWDTAEALRNGKELEPDELRELEEAARAQLTAE